MRTNLQIATMISWLLVSGHGSIAAQEKLNKPIRTTICEIRDSPLRFKGKLVQVRGTFWTDNLEKSSIQDRNCGIMPTVTAVFNNPEWKKLRRLVGEPDIEPGTGKWRYEVQATFVGRIKTVYRLSSDGKLVRPEGAGFGHMHLAPTTILVTDIFDVVANEREPRPPKFVEVLK